jgi:hypothetical protein
MELEPAEVQEEPPTRGNLLLSFQDVWDHFLEHDAEFKGLVTDYFLSPEALAEAERHAPALPSRLQTGPMSEHAPAVLSEAQRAILTALKYSIRSLQYMRTADRTAANDILSSVKLQMSAATRMQEAIFGRMYNVSPEAMKAFFVNKQLPRTIAPFARQFFRYGPGGAPLSGTFYPAEAGGGLVARAPDGLGPGGGNIYIGSPPYATPAPPIQQQPQLQQLQQFFPGPAVPQPLAQAQPPPFLAQLPTPLQAATVQAQPQPSPSFGQPVFVEPTRPPSFTQPPATLLAVQPTATSAFVPFAATPYPAAPDSPAAPFGPPPSPRSSGQGFGWGTPAPSFGGGRSAGGWPDHASTGPSFAADHVSVPGSRRGRNGGGRAKKR